MQPQFVLKPSIVRIMFPELLKVIGLTVVFYLGVMLNLYLLRYEATNNIIFTLVGICVLLIVSHTLFTYFRASKIRYNFYADRIEQVNKERKTIYLYTIIMTDYSKNYLDKIFGTINILIKPDFKIMHVKDSNQVLYYIQNLIKFAKK